MTQDELRRAIEPIVLDESLTVEQRAQKLMPVQFALVAEYGIGPGIRILSAAINAVRKEHGRNQ